MKKIFLVVCIVSLATVSQAQRYAIIDTKYILDKMPDYKLAQKNLDDVAANWQKAGIGKNLLQECARRIYSKAQSHKMYLWVYESNQNARKVYERLGATHIETVEQPTASGITAPACRYVWADVAVLLST